MLKKVVDLDLSVDMISASEVTNGDDGVKAYDEITDIDFIENSEIVAYFDAVEASISEGAQTYGLDIPCFVAVTGAGAGISTLIVQLCGAPCSVAPPLCAVCLGGIIVVGGGTILGAVIACWE